MREVAHVFDVVVGFVLAGGLLFGVPGVDTLENAETAVRVLFMCVGVFGGSGVSCEFFEEEEARGLE